MENKIRLNRTGACIAMMGLFLVVRTLIAVMKPGHMNLGILLLGIVLVMMLLQLALVQSVVLLGLTPKRSALWALLCAVAYGGGFVVMAYVLKSHPPLPVVYGMVGLHQLMLMLLAVFLGVTISYIIRERNLLLPVVIVAALVDFWNVYVGPLGHVVATRPDIIDKVTVRMPAPAPGMPVPMIGMGDFVFLGLYLSVIFRYGMRVKGTFWLGYALMTITMLAVLTIGLPVPALVPMALAVIIANVGLFKLKREEMLATILVSFIVLALLTASGLHMLRHQQRATHKVHAGAWPPGSLDYTGKV